MCGAQGLVTDETKVVFFTNATAYEDWPTGGLLGNGTGRAGGVDELAFKACTQASSKRQQAQQRVVCSVSRWLD